jgi:Short C-terminal domain
VGLRDIFSGRRKDESAIPEGMSSGEIGSTGAEGDHHLDLSNPAGIAGLGQMIQAAQQQGQVTVSSGQMGMIDARGNEDLRNAILQTLKDHGVDAQKGQQIQVTDPALMQAIFKTIAEHRGELGQMQAQAMQAFSQMGESGQLQGMAQMGGGTTSPMPPAPTGASADVSALEKLNELRQSGALTQDEFDAEKKKLLGS